MYRYFLTILFFLPIAFQQAYAVKPDWYAAAYDSIRDVDQDDCLRTEVSNFEFDIDRARIILQEGYLYALPPVAGHIFECMFNGKGKILISPPDEVERLCIKKYLKTDSVDVDFDQFRIIASPDLIDRYFDFSSATNSEPPQKLKSFRKTSNGILKNDKWNIYASALGEAVGDAGSYAWVHFNREKKRRNILGYTDLDTEPLRFFKRSRHQLGDYPELIFSCFPLEHYQSGKSWKYRKPTHTIDPVKYVIDAGIDERARLSCKATLDFVSLRDSVLSLYALIFDKTDIDSVLDSNGDSLYVSKMKDEPGFTVFLPEPLSKGDSTELTFYYRSDDIISKSQTGDFYIDDQVDWYPIFEYLVPSIYDVTFSWPKQLTLVSVGDKVLDSIEGDVSITRWVTKQPELFTSFNYGLFDSLTLHPEGAPEVKIYRGQTHTGDIFKSDMKQNVGDDVVGALQLFTKLYGPIRFNPIRVAEIPYSRGQGMPGLLHLAWGTFQDDDPIWDAAFRAHEVAHQWWGHTVRWGNYHDQWMSEAFSEFSGAIYVQHKLEDDDKYFQILDVWRRDAVQKGRTFRGSWSAGTDAGPIWLGLRLSSSKSDDFMSLSYSKGGYIMHVLRCMMMDWDTMSDDRFFDMMRDYVKTYRNRVATTEDFQRMVEDHIGEPMDWFFDQWIFGIEVPGMSMEEKVREEAGDFFIDFVIKQDHVSGDFKSIVPIKIKFEDDSAKIVKVVAIGKATTATSGPFKSKPKDIEFNYYKAVLTR